MHKVWLQIPNPLPAQVEEEEYQLKPMNCPFHVGIYKEGYYSYRDLPLRMAELGTVYRCVSLACVAGWQSNARALLG